MENFIKEIAKKAGKAVLEKFGKAKVEYTKKNITEVVTEADLLSTKIITEAIRVRYPDHGIVSEESSDLNRNAEYLWIIDPLDGTRNFSTNVPLFGLAIGFAKDQKMELSVAYLPFYDELFFAKKDKGAFKNYQKIQCSETKEFQHSFGCGGAVIAPERLEYLKKLVKIAEKEPFWMSGLGCAVLNAVYVADGRRDWYMSRSGGVWDYAASSLILSEAGCKVTNFKGEPWSLKDEEILTANKYLHPKLLEILK